MEKTIFIGFLVIAYLTVITQSKTCTNGRTDCEGYKQYCKTARYVEWMKLNCKMTCGYCEKKCGDATYYTPSCKAWRNRGYCKNPVYKVTVELYCKKTCQLCGTTKKLPVKGSYGEWSIWSPCDRTCGGGTKKRSRACDNPAPKYGGTCSGNSQSSSSCNTQACKSYTTWSAWTNCDRSCGGGTQVRERRCVAPTCSGELKGSQPCNIEPCKKGGDCSDIPEHAGNCKVWSPYCKEGNEYYPFMQKNCRKTCKFCTEGPPRPPVVVNTCGRNKEVAIIGRVIGGVDAFPYRWNWQGGLYYFGDFVCGGALIAENLFLTAAHCVYIRGAVGMVVRMGDHKRSEIEGPEQNITVEKLIWHDGWSTSTIQNDIAILKLKDNFKLNDKVGLICLPKEDEAPPKKTTCYITGWGKTKIDGPGAEILQEAKLPIVPNLVCGAKNVDSDDNSRIVDSMICGGFKNIDSVVSGCMGDSGGPYVCKKGEKWILHGLVSWGSRRCEASHRFTVFTRVSKFITWIDEKSEKLNN